MPHSWEDTTLVIAATDEAWVERIMDQVDEELSAAPEDQDEEEEQVVYDLSEWDDESCVALLDALSADTIPYGLDGDELVIGAVDEKRVDEIVAALTTPGATLTVGGPASFEAMSELFVAADELQQRPRRQGRHPRHRRGSPRRGRRQRSVRHGPRLVGRCGRARGCAGRPGRDAERRPRAHRGAGHRRPRRAAPVHLVPTGHSPQ